MIPQHKILRQTAGGGITDGLDGDGRGGKEVLNEGRMRTPNRAGTLRFKFPIQPENESRVIVK